MSLVWILWLKVNCLIKLWKKDDLRAGFLKFTYFEMYSKQGFCTLKKLSVIFRHWSKLSVFIENNKACQISIFQLKQEPVQRKCRNPALWNCLYRSSFLNRSRYNFADAKKLYCKFRNKTHWSCTKSETEIDTEAKPPDISSQKKCRSRPRFWWKT